MQKTETIGLRSSEHFGARLAARRESYGLTQADVSATTNIRADYIAAIEALDQDALPAIGYTLGYVRTYAKALGMDANIAVKNFKADIELSKLPLRDAPHVIFRRHWRLPRGFISALTVASTAMAIGLWYGSQSVAVATPEPMIDIAPQYTALAPAMPDMQAGLFTLRATSPSWIQIRDAQGTVELSRIFTAGETWQGPTAAGYSVSVRDAGAVELYDGVELIGALGQPGEPREGLKLSAHRKVAELPITELLTSETP